MGKEFERSRNPMPSMKRMQLPEPASSQTEKCEGHLQLSS